MTVVVSMMFVLFLGAALLFASYTAYSVEATQRGAKNNFYNADSAMEDIRLGVQTLLSDAVKNAYAVTLVDYIGAHPSSYNAQSDFSDRITAELLKATVTLSDGSKLHVFKSGTNGSGMTIIKGYTAEALKTFVSASAQSNAKVFVGADEVSDISITDGTADNIYTSGTSTVLKALSLKNVSVKYTSAGYESNITTDILITMPYFFAASSVNSGINKYAVIADNSLLRTTTGSSTPSTTISGSVFTGKNGITLSGTGNSLSFTNGDLICKGPITVDEGTAFGFNATENELWADDLTINGSATLDGNVYVANDLLLNHDGAAVTLKNAYFGFGDSSSTPDSSSSILVNGKGCSLNISQLSRLSLAGISFINTASQSLTNIGDSGTFGSDIPMGQSMSIKPDQLAYLVPLACISNYPSNPYLFTGDTVPPPSINYDTILWGKGDNAKSLSDYIDVDDTGSKGNIVTLYNTVDPTAKAKVVYVFMVFISQSYANAYFKDYFASDPAKIKQYMNIYLSLSDKSASAIIDTAGNTYYQASGSTLTLNPAKDRVYATGAQLLYNKMYSPYQIFINEVALTKLPSKLLKFRDSSNNVVAVVSSADTYTYDAGEERTIRLILAQNNVVVTSNFTGVIISGNNVTANSSITGELPSSSIMDSTCTDGSQTYTLWDFVNNSSQLTASSSSENLWNLDALVSYENWLKH